MSEDIATPSLAALARDGPDAKPFGLDRWESPVGVLRWPLSMRVVCFGGTPSSALIYGVVPMAEVAHMASLTIIAPALFVEVVACILPGGGGGGGGGGAVSLAVSWATYIMGM